MRYSDKFENDTFTLQTVRKVLSNQCVKLRFWLIAPNSVFAQRIETMTKFTVIVGCNLMLVNPNLTNQ